MKRRFLTIVPLATSLAMITYEVRGESAPDPTAPPTGTEAAKDPAASEAKPADQPPPDSEAVPAASGAKPADQPPPVSDADPAVSGAKPADQRPPGDGSVLPPRDSSDRKGEAQPSGAAQALKDDPGKGDLLKRTITMGELGQPMVLQGITLRADLRDRATDPAKVWEKKNKDEELQSGVQLDDKLETPDMDDLRSSLGKFIGKPATYGDLQKMVEVIQKHYVKHHRPMTHVYVPKQWLFSDKVVISIVEGKVGETLVLTEAALRGKPNTQLTKSEKAFLADRDKERTWWNSWYNNPYKAADVKEEFLPRTNQLKGKVVDTEEITAQIDAMNRSPWVRLNRPASHPFRDVSVKFTQPEADVLGRTDLIFEVADQRPLKFFTGVDNSLTEITGENRLFLGAAWYDAFMLGKNHQLGAQVFSAIAPDELLGFSVNYQIPWQDQKFNQFTEFFASYAVSTAEVILGGIPTDSEGSTLIFGGRHYLELPGLFGATGLSQPLLEKRTHTWAKPEREAMGLHHEVGAGVDFKISDNNLLFGGDTLAESPATIAQFVLEYNARQTDPTGETNLTTQLYISPGDLSDNNTDEAFNPLRKDAEAAYVYTKLRLEREQDLPFTGNLSGMMVRGALTGQYASSNLLASEQLGLGGFSSVRGYPERALRGDLGVIFNLELFSPEFQPAKNWFKQSWFDEEMLKFLVFFDYAHGESSSENSADPLDDPADLMSVGAGLRYEINDALRLRLDYGFRLEDLPSAADNADNGAVHFGLIYIF